MESSTKEKRKLIFHEMHLFKCRAWYEPITISIFKTKESK